MLAFQVAVKLLPTTKMDVAMFFKYVILFNCTSVYVRYFQSTPTFKKKKKKEVHHLFERSEILKLQRLIQYQWVIQIDSHLKAP